MVCMVMPCVCLGHIVWGDELVVPSRDKKLSPGTCKNPAVSTHEGETQGVLPAELYFLSLQRERISHYVAYGNPQ